MPPRADISDLTSHLGFWLRMVSNHVSRAFAAKVAERGVTVAEWALMRALYGREPTAPSRVADEMGMTRGAITKLADRLIEKGMILRTASIEDGRAQTLTLTPKAEALVPDLAALADRNDEEFFHHLSPEDRKALERILRQLVATGRMTTIPTQ